jgi:signal transduction histidine kinase
MRELVARSGARWGMAVAAPLAAGTLVMLLIAYSSATYALYRTLDQSVIEQLELLSARPPALLPFMISSRMHHGPGVVTLVGLFSPDGTAIVGDIRAIPPGLTLNGKVHDLRILDTDPTTPERERAAGRQLPDGRILIVARDTAGVLDLRAGLLRALVLAMVPALLLSLAGAALLGHGTRRRLLRLQAAAERIIAGRLDERLPVRTPGDELDQLALIVNRILARMEELVAALKGVGEDIAHDMRTPLATVRARLERARADPAAPPHVTAAIGRAIGGIDRALATMAALLRIAEVEQGRRRAGFAPFDLAEAVREIADAYRPLAEERAIAFAVAAAGPAPATGDRDLFMEAVANLIDNAVKFTPRGGSVRVTLTGPTGRAMLRVADSGPGIAPEERALVFRRFYRSDRSRHTSGTGLGLPLVAAVARLHGFALRVTEGAPGCVMEMDCWPDEAAARADQAAGTGATGAAGPDRPAA